MTGSRSYSVPTIWWSAWSNLVVDEEIFNPPTAWLVDEIAETLMPFLANGDDDDDQPELPPDLPEPGPKPDQPGLAERIGNVDLSGRPAEIHHADVVNVYQAPVTINNYGAAMEVESSEEVAAD